MRISPDTREAIVRMAKHHPPIAPEDIAKGLEVARSTVDKVLKANGAPPLAPKPNGHAPAANGHKPKARAARRPRAPRHVDGVAAAADTIRELRREELLDEDLAVTPKGRAWLGVLESLRDA